MKKIWLAIMFLLISLFVQSAFAGVVVEGSENLLNYEHWLPKKAYIAFYYDQGRVSGCRVIFQASDGKLFNEWKMTDLNGNSQKFPFILESTLIIENAGEVDETGKWGFGRLDGDNSETPNAYLDSTFCDLGTNNYGIGIMDPYKLEENELYDYWIELEPSDWFSADPSNLRVMLRFRLNIDLVAAKKFGYSKEDLSQDFDIGVGWDASNITGFGYNAVDVSKNPSSRDIGNYFSFAIEKYKSSDKKTYSNYFVLDGMVGQWFKSRDGEVSNVDSLEESFDLDSESPEFKSANDFNDLSGSPSPDELPDSSSIIANPYTPTELPDIRVHSVRVFDSDDNELKSEKSYVEAGRTYDVEFWLISEEANAKNGMKSGKKNIEADVYFKFGAKDSDGEWKKLGRTYTQPDSLPKGKKHKESLSFTVPEGFGNSRLYFKVVADPTHEVEETDEDNNVSHWEEEWYGVAGDYDLKVSSIYPKDSLYERKVGEKVGFGILIENNGDDTPLIGIQSGYAVKKPGQTEFKVFEEDGSDAKDLVPGRTQEESTPNDALTLDVPGSYEIRACTDIKNVLPETDENNNCKTCFLNVTMGSLNLEIVSAGIKEGALIKNGTKIHPWVLLRLTGNTRLSRSFIIHYIIDDEVRDDDTVEPDELIPGGSPRKEEINNNDLKMGKKGNRVLIIKIDAKKSISESNENDNEIRIPFVVK